MNVIFDLDGTLADIRHRRPLVENGNNNWDEFFKQCVNDIPKTMEQIMHPEKYSTKEEHQNLEAEKIEDDDEETSFDEDDI